MFASYDTLLPVSFIVRLFSRLTRAVGWQSMAGFFGTGIAERKR